MARPTFSTEARDEYDRAHDYYLARSVSAAIGFEATVEERLQVLEAFPGLGTPVDGRHRRHQLRRYPYGLVYRQLVDGQVRVVGVSHDRQLVTDLDDRDPP